MCESKSTDWLVLACAASHSGLLRALLSHATALVLSAPVAAEMAAVAPACCDVSQLPTPDLQRSNILHLNFLERIAREALRVGQEPRGLSM